MLVKQGRKFMSFFTIWIVQSAVTCESGRASSRKSVYFGISKLILYFPYFMYHVWCMILFTVYFHTVISVLRTSIYAVFVIDRTRKQTLLMKWVHFVFTKDLPSISQSNVQAAKLKRKSNMLWVTWYTLNYQTVVVFSLRSILKLLKCTQTIKQYL